MSRETSPALTAQIIGHPLVRKINVGVVNFMSMSADRYSILPPQFTGSDRVGRIIATEAAKYLKPTVLELGGKAPSVVRIPDLLKPPCFIEYVMIRF
jgi:hypothetical protein